jgi:hypothetical protein
MSTWGAVVAIVELERRAGREPEVKVREPGIVAFPPGELAEASSSLCSTSLFAGMVEEERGGGGQRVGFSMLV